MRCPTSVVAQSSVALLLLTAKKQRPTKHLPLLFWRSTPALCLVGFVHRPQARLIAAGIHPPHSRRPRGRRWALDREFVARTALQRFASIIGFPRISGPRFLVHARCFFFLPSAHPLRTLRHRSPRARSPSEIPPRQGQGCAHSPGRGASSSRGFNPAVNEVSRLCARRAKQGRFAHQPALCSAWKPRRRQAAARAGRRRRILTTLRFFGPSRLGRRLARYRIDTHSEWCAACLRS